GRGQGILVGSYVACPYRRQSHEANGALLASLVELADLSARPAVEGGRVRVDVLATEAGERMVILQNLETQPVEVVVTVPAPLEREDEEQRGRATLSWTRREDGGSAAVRRDPRGVRVCRV